MSYKADRKHVSDDKCPLSNYDTIPVDFKVTPKILWSEQEKRTIENSRGL